MVSADPEALRRNQACWIWGSILTGGAPDPGQALDAGRLGLAVSAAQQHDLGSDGSLLRNLESQARKLSSWWMVMQHRSSKSRMQSGA